MSGKAPAEALGAQLLSGEHTPLACSRRQLAGDMRTALLRELHEASRQTAEMNRLAACAPQT